ncbi:hypothetical protein, partial [Alistipes shahii]
MLLIPAILSFVKNKTVQRYENISKISKIRAAQKGCRPYFRELFILTRMISGFAYRDRAALPRVVFALSAASVSRRIVT